VLGLLGVRPRRASAVASRVHFASPRPHQSRAEGMLHEAFNMMWPGWGGYLLKARSYRPPAQDPLAASSWCPGAGHVGDKRALGALQPRGEHVTALCPCILI
jgi:hypothetical protein